MARLTPGSAFVLLGMSGLGNAAGADGVLTIGTGFDYSRGSYGESPDTEILYLPVSVKYETSRWFAKLTIPYLEITGPSDVVIIDGRPVSSGGATSRSSEAGLGDVVASAGYTAYENAWAGFILDVIGKVKLPTADENKGLGSGKTDYAFQIDALKSFAAYSLLGTAGYRWLGSPAGVELNDVWFMSAGLVRKFSTEWSGGVLYDYREASTAMGSPQSEATIYASHSLSSQSRAQLYVVHGFGDGSPDWGIGGSVSRSF